MVQMLVAIPGTLPPGSSSVIFENLPDLGESFTSLLLVSHATYLVAKAHDASSPS